MTPELYYLFQVLPVILLYAGVSFLAGALCGWLFWHERGREARRIEAENRRLRHRLQDLQREAL